MFEKRSALASVTSRLGNLGLALTLGSLFVASGSATMIQSGVANFNGSVVVNNAAISFTPNAFNTGLPNNGSFAGLTSGSVQNLVGGTTTLTDFITLNVAAGTVFFDLQGFSAGTGTVAACGSDTVGNVCTPPGSFFTLTQNQGGVSIVLNAFGQAYIGTSASGTTGARVLFTAQQVPGTLSAILAASGTPAGFQDSYSATIAASAVPEPGSMMLMGLGFAGIATVARKRFVK